MSDSFLREQVVNFLKSGQAHMSVADAVKDFPMEHINDVFPNGEYTFWHLLEHIRFTQKDILDFMIDPEYTEPEWPRDYWPAKDAKATPEQWKKTIDEYESDLEALIVLVEDKKTDLSGKVPKGTGQTFLKEFLMVADHTSYHVGEFGIMRQVLKLWHE